MMDQKVFNWFANNFNLTLLESEWSDIQKFVNEEHEKRIDNLNIKLLASTKKQLEFRNTIDNLIECKAKLEVENSILKGTLTVLEPFEGFDSGCIRCIHYSKAKVSGDCARGFEHGFKQCGVSC